MDDPTDALHRFYALEGERDRLTATARGVLEFERTKEILLRRLPPPPAVVADVGGGPGRYAMWLAGRGYRVEHRDLVPLHVDQLRADAHGLGLIGTAVADARAIDLGDGAVDAVLLLGPVYHLRRRAERLQALGEARRIVRPGGPVFVAAISRWAPRLDGELRGRLYEPYPQVREEVPRIERTGWLPPLFPGSFSAYCHRPGQLRAEVRRRPGGGRPSERRGPGVRPERPGGAHGRSGGPDRGPGGGTGARARAGAAGDRAPPGGHGGPPRG
jgi:SAM-dependent methyltransferase